MGQTKVWMKHCLKEGVRILLPLLQDILQRVLPLALHLAPRRVEAALLKEQQASNKTGVLFFLLKGIPLPRDLGNVTQLEVSGYSAGDGGQSRVKGRGGEALWPWREAGWPQKLLGPRGSKGAGGWQIRQPLTAPPRDRPSPTVTLGSCNGNPLQGLQRSAPRSMLSFPCHPQSAKEFRRCLLSWSRSQEESRRQECCRHHPSHSSFLPKLQRLLGTQAWLPVFPSSPHFTWHFRWVRWEACCLQQ